MDTSTKMHRRTISQRSELIYDIHNFGVNADTREIFLHPDCNVENDHAEIDHRVASNLIKNIRFLNSQNDTPIIIHMCSCGGNFEYGLAIYDAIKTSPTVVYIISYAHARSMSSIILQSADIRILSPNTYVMIHEGTDGYEGSNQGLITHAKQAENATMQMLNIYAYRCNNGNYFKAKNMNTTQIANFIKKQMRQKQEWYLPAKEAIEYGFADYILNEHENANLDNIINSV